MADKFDVIVVGAGPSGNAAAYTLAKAGLSVLQLERGETPGTKNVQGAILYADALERIIPDFRDHAPLERHIVEQRMWLMDEGQAVTGMNYSRRGILDAAAQPLHHRPRPFRPLVLRAGQECWRDGDLRNHGDRAVARQERTGDRRADRAS